MQMKSPKRLSRPAGNESEDFDDIFVDGLDSDEISVEVTPGVSSEVSRFWRISRSRNDGDYQLPPYRDDHPRSDGQEFQGGENLYLQ